MEKLISGKALTLRIATLAKNTKGWIKEIEFLAQSACVECVKTRNTSSINRLAEATKHIGARALMRWIQKNGPVVWDKDKKAFVLSDDKHKSMSEDVEKYQAELAKAPSYTAEAKESDSNPFTSFNLRERLISLHKQASEKQKDHERRGKQDKSGKADNFTGLAALADLIATMPVAMERKAKAPAPKPKSGKGRRITAKTETANVAAV
jgi:hypothetical protein